MPQTDPKEEIKYTDLGCLREVVVRLFEATSVPQGEQMYVERAFTKAAQELGVQPNDLRLLKRERNHPREGKTEDCVVGFADPHPSEGRPFISLKDFQIRQWGPPSARPQAPPAQPGLPNWAQTGDSSG